MRPWYSLAAAVAFCAGVSCARSRTAADAAITPAPAPDGHTLAVELASLVYQDMPQFFSNAPPVGGVEGPESQAVVQLTVAWAQKYLPRDTLLAISARAYERTYSQPELRGLVEFFRSPLGRRYMQGQHGLLTSTRASVDSLLGPHRAELQQQLMEFVRRAVQP